MGNKVHATSFRLSTLKNWTSLWFDNSFKNSTYIQQDILIKDFLTNYFYQRNISISNLYINRLNDGTIIINCSFYLLNGLLRSKFPFNSYNKTFFTNSRKFLPRTFQSFGNYNASKSVAKRTPGNFSKVSLQRLSTNLVKPTNFSSVAFQKVLNKNFYFCDKSTFSVLNKKASIQPTQVSRGVSRLFFKEIYKQVLTAGNAISHVISKKNGFSTGYFNYNLHNTGKTTPFFLALVAKNRLARFHRLRRNKRYYLLKFRLRDSRKKAFIFVDKYRHQVHLFKNFLSFRLLARSSNPSFLFNFLFYFKFLKFFKGNVEQFTLKNRRFLIVLSSLMGTLGTLDKFKKKKSASYFGGKPFVKNEFVVRKNFQVSNVNSSSVLLVKQFISRKGFLFLQKKKYSVGLSSKMGNISDAMKLLRRKKGSILRSFVVKYCRFNYYYYNLKLGYYLNDSKFELEKKRLRFAMLFRNNNFRFFRLRTKKKVKYTRKYFNTMLSSYLGTRKIGLKSKAIVVSSSSKTTKFVAKKKSFVKGNNTISYNNNFNYNYKINPVNLLILHYNKKIGNNKTIFSGINRIFIKKWGKASSSMSNRFRSFKPKSNLNMYLNEKYYYYILIKYNLFFVNKIIKKITGLDKIQWEFFIQKQSTLNSTDIAFFLKKNLNKKRQQRLANPMDMLKSQLKDNITFLEQVHHIKSSLWSANIFNLHTKLFLKKQFKGVSLVNDSFKNIKRQLLVSKWSKIHKLSLIKFKLNNLSLFNITNRFLKYKDDFYYSKLNMTLSSKNNLLVQRPFLNKNISYFYKDSNNSLSKLSLNRKKNILLTNFYSIFNNIVSTNGLLGNNKVVFNFNDNITNKINQKFISLVKGFHILGSGRLGLSRKSARSSITTYKIGKTVKNSLNVSIDFISDHHIIRNGSYGLKIYKLYQTFNMEQYQNKLLSLYLK